MTLSSKSLGSGLMMGGLVVEAGEEVTGEIGARPLGRIEPSLKTHTEDSHCTSHACKYNSLHL